MHWRKIFSLGKKMHKESMVASEEEVLAEIQPEEIKPLIERNVYRHGGGWGNSIQLDQWKDGSMEQSCTGWKYNTPKEGDLLEVRMDSGKEALFEFTSVYKMGDPVDMFSGKIKILDYTQKLREEGKLPMDQELNYV